MKLSTRTRYGIRALIDLAHNIDEKPVSVKDIARRQNISTRYLENIFHELKIAGILGSSKGKGGGFYLVKPLKEINILLLIDILDGELAILDCLVDISSCKNPDGCYTRSMWKKLNSEIRQAFARINLEDVFRSLDK